MIDELDDMKNIWQNAAALPGLDAQQLEVLLAKRSKNAFVKIRRNLLMEAVLGFFILGLLVFGTVCSPTAPARFAVALLLFVCLPLFLFYYYGFKFLKKGLPITGNLKATLTTSIAFWKQALRLYFLLGVLLLPVVFIAARWWRFSVMQNGDIQFFTGSPALIVFKMMVAWALVAAMLWGLIYLSYGRWVKRLEKCLEEMEGIA